MDFAAIEEGFDWKTALIEADTREHYGEVRLVAYGVIAGRLYTLVYMIRRTAAWIISLRKSSQKEARRYAAQD